MGIAHRGTDILLTKKLLNGQADAAFHCASPHHPSPITRCIQKGNGSPSEADELDMTRPLILFNLPHRLRSD